MVYCIIITDLTRERRMRKNKKGFTLVELLIVMIIVGVLAAVAAPMMQSNVNKAKKSEGVAGMGAIRTAVRLYSVEYSTNPTSLTNLVSNGFINQSDLNGKYYNYGNYSYSSGVISATTPSGVTGSTMTMDADGNISNYQ